MAPKRKAPLSSILKRRVRPRREDDEDIADLSGDESPAVSDANGHELDGDAEAGSLIDSEDEDEEDDLGSGDWSGSGTGSSSDDDEDDDTSRTGDSHDDDEEEDEESLLRTISFGALARARQSLLQDASPAPLHRPSINNSSRSTSHSKPKPPITTTAAATAAVPAPERRPHKHAPTVLSSKQRVSSKREVIAVPKRAVRDPRFDALSTSTGAATTRNAAQDADRLRRNYAFLEEYRADEMRQLREAIRKSRDGDVRGRLKVELGAMESRQRAQQAKDKNREIVRSHRAREKELVKQGKKPFYLKRAEQKKLALMDRFAELKGRDGKSTTSSSTRGGVGAGEGAGAAGSSSKRVEKAMEKKRRKDAARERKRMPDVRRRRGRPD